MTQSTNLTQAVDFTVTDCHGNEIHLFDILDRGQAVFIDLAQYGGIQQHNCETIDCDAPTNLSLSMGNDEIALQWNASSTAISYNVYRDGTKIATVDETSFVDSALDDQHDYCYKVTANCEGYLESDPTNEECITFMGVSENETGDFRLFPNPVKDFLTITGETSINVLIYNVLGQKVGEFGSEETTLTISTSNLVNGVYLLKINGNHTKRLVVSHE